MPKQLENRPDYSEDIGVHLLPFVASRDTAEGRHFWSVKAPNNYNDAIALGFSFGAHYCSYLRAQAPNSHLAGVLRWIVRDMREVSADDENGQAVISGFFNFLDHYTPLLAVVIDPWREHDRLVDYWAECEAQEKSGGAK